jgi:hypothetical protein
MHVHVDVRSRQMARAAGPARKSLVAAATATEGMARADTVDTIGGVVGLATGQEQQAEQDGGT